MSYSGSLTISFHPVDDENINISHHQSTKKQIKKIATISIPCMSILLILAIVGIILSMKLPDRTKEFINSTTSETVTSTNQLLPLITTENIITINSSSCQLPLYPTYNRSGTTVAGIKDTAGYDSYHLKYPSALYCDDKENIYIGDSSKIVKYSFNNIQEGVIVDYISGPNSVVIYIDPQNDDLYYIDSDEKNYYQVKYVPFNGTKLKGIVLLNGSKSICYGMTLDSNLNIYVSEHDNHLVVKWLSPTYKDFVIIAGNGTRGTEMNQLAYPQGLYLDPINNDLYIADSNRIQLWPAGATTGQSVIQNRLSYPTTIRRDCHGNFYILGERKVKLFSPSVDALGLDGVVLIGIDYKDLTDELLNTIDYFTFVGDICLNAKNGDVYVTDTNHHRIRKFSINGQINIAYDIIVYTATPGGIAAAITAARASSSLKIAIIEPTAYIGGMVTAGGIGLGDIGLLDTVLGSVAFDWIQNNDQYYKVNSSQHVYQPNMEVGTQSFLNMLAVHSNIELILSTGPLLLGSIRMNGTRIVQACTSISARIWEASMWIDASYEGDLTRFSGASYTWGRESRDQYNESYAGVLPYQTGSNFLPNFPIKATFDNGTIIPFVSSVPLGPAGSADLNMMGFSYRLCVATVPEKQAPFFKPANYDPNNYILLQRYIETLVASGKYPLGPRIETIVSIGKYHGYPPGDKYDICGTGSSAFNSDAISLNQGYVNGTAEDRLRIAQQTSDYILGMFWYILTSSLVPNYTRTTLERYGLCNDQWIENNHIPPQLYVREGLRLVNDNVFTQHHIRSGLCLNDTVALGSWYYDVHVVTRTVNGTYVNNEGYVNAPVAHLNGSKSGPAFEMPYSIMLPKVAEVTNLLVPVCHAATHVAYSATRVEPHFMLLGSAAGYAAAYAIANGNINVQSVDVGYIQKMLTNDGVLLHYPKGHCDK